MAKETAEPTAPAPTTRKVNRELASIGVKISDEAPSNLLGPTRTMTLKGAKTAAAAAATKEIEKTRNQQVLDKERLREHLENLSKKRKINHKQLQWNLDSMSIPENVASIFPNKVALFQQMRAFEKDLKSYTKAKVTNVKEDILRRGQKIKRTLKLMLEAD